MPVGYCGGEKISHPKKSSAFAVTAAGNVLWATDTPFRIQQSREGAAKSYGSL